MSKFNLTKPFAGALESVPFQDPWTGETTWHIRPLFHGPYQDAIAGDSQKSNFRRAAFAKTGRQLAKLASRAMRKGEKLDGATVGEQFDKVFDAALDMAIDEAPDEIFIPGGAKADPEKIVLLVDHVDALIGEGNVAVEPYDAATHLEVLRDETRVPPSQPYGGQSVGDALCAWILERSAEVARTLDTAKERVEGESEGSCGGDSASLVS